MLAALVETAGVLSDEEHPEWLTGQQTASWVKEFRVQNDNRDLRGTLSVAKTALIGHLRGRQEVVSLINGLASQGRQLGICGISLAELYSGLNPSERASADRLTDVLDFSPSTGNRPKKRAATGENPPVRAGGSPPPTPS